MNATASEAKDNAEKYQEFYLQFSRFIKEGVITDYKHREALAKLLRFESSMTEEGKFTGLDDYVTRSGYVITPVILLCDRVGAPRPNPSEVAAVHCVALDDLERPEVPRIHHIKESDRPVLSLPLLGTFSHAPTAAVLYQFREVALHGRATRVAHFEQPVFAWR